MRKKKNFQGMWRKFAIITFFSLFAGLQEFLSFCTHFSITSSAQTCRDFFRLWSSSATRCWPVLSFSSCLEQSHSLLRWSSSDISTLTLRWTDNSVQQLRLCCKRNSLWEKVENGTQCKSETSVLCMVCRLSNLPEFIGISQWPLTWCEVWDRAGLTFSAVLILSCWRWRQERCYWISKGT